MIRGLLTTKAIVLVILAAFQGLVLAAFPMVNYWRADIEAILSKRLDATVKISEIGARASWTGPYLEALNLIIQRDSGSLEVRRVQMLLDLPASLGSFEPVIGQLVLDEGEIVQRGSTGAGIPNPKAWAGLLNELHNAVRPIGKFQLHNFDVLLGDLSLKRLSVSIDPAIGLLAQTRLVTEEMSLPLEVDWRYPSDASESHDLRVHTWLHNAPVPGLGLDELFVGIDATAWLNLKDGAPVEGIVRVSGLPGTDQGLDGDIRARFELPGSNAISASFESLQLQLPGIKVAGSGGGIQFDGSRVIAKIPRLEADGRALGEFLKSHGPDPTIARLLALNQPTVTANSIQLDWLIDESPIIVAEIEAFEIQAGRSIPHVGPVQGQIFVEGSRGWFDFEANSATFSLPEIFPRSWKRQELSGTLVFDRTGDGLLLKGHDLRVQDNQQDVRGALLLDLPRDAEQRMHLELTVNASTGALAGLLPHALDSEVSDFLTRAVEEVDVDQGRISYSGPLGAEVDRSRRELSMHFPMTAYRFKPLTTWPAFVGTEGVVDFASKRTRIEFVDSDFGGLSVSRVVATQDRDDGRRIQIDGHLSGEAPVALNILDQAQVKLDSLGSEMLLNGSLRGDVSLSVPIGESPEGKVVIESDDLVVTISELGEPFTHVKGRAEYRFNDGLYTETLKGELFGNPVEARITITNDQIDIRGRGRVQSADAIRLLDNADIKPDLLGTEILLEGSLLADIQLEIPTGKRAQGVVTIEPEDLVITLAELIAPITGVRGRAEYRLNEGLYTEVLTGQLLGDPIEATVMSEDGQTTVVGQGRLRTANVSRLMSLGFDESQLYGAADWSILGRSTDQGFLLSLETDGRGLGSHLPEPLGKDADQTGRIVVNLNSTPEFQNFNAKLFETTEVRGQLGIMPLVIEIITPQANIVEWVALPLGGGSESNLSILLRTERLVFGKIPLQVNKTAITIMPDEFNISFDGIEMAGRVSRISEGPLLIDLERLVLPEGGDLLDPPEEDPLFDYNPGQLPSAKIRVSQLKRGETNYQDINIVLVSGDSRLDATTLEFDRDGQRFQGELAWVFQNGEAKSALLLRAHGSELGNILRVNEDEPLLEADSGRFVSNLTWAGSPLGFSVLTSEGEVELSLEDGRFLDLGNSAEVLRLFGILNIETVTRRLRLDFLDVVQPGVAFDSVSAKAKISGGLLKFSPELAMKGPSSSFRMTGTADLVTQQLNQKLEIDIPLTNNLPLASVLLGAPQVGGAIYLVEKALGTKIIKVGKTDYRIEGSFDDPQVSLIPPFSNKKDHVNADTPANR